MSYLTNSIKEFKSGIQFLTENIEYINDVKQFFLDARERFTVDSDEAMTLQRFFTETIAPANSRMRRHVYQSAIISLYGLLERYIEDIIVEYLNEICIISKSYERLPKDVKKNHFQSSLEFLTKVNKWKGFTPEEREEKIKIAIKNVHECMNPKYNPCTINVDAFKAHSTNFRYDSIQEYFNRVGINNAPKSCLEYSDFCQCLLEKSEQDKNIFDIQTLTSLLVSELGDLAQRRNEIAHGVSDIEIQTSELIVSRIKFIASFCETLNKVINDSYFNHLFIISEKITIGHPSRVFTGRKAFGFENCTTTSNQKIKSNDIVLARNEHSKKRILRGKVTALMSNGAIVQEISLPTQQPFSIQVDFEFSSRSVNREIIIIQL